MNIDQFKRVAVIGWGKSGISLTHLLLSLGKKVKVTETKERKEFYPILIDRLKDQGVEFEFGGHSKDFLKDADLAVLSPGVDPYTSSAIKNCQELGISYFGEVEFSFWLTKAKFVAITGTNGKTTTTFLTHQVLKQQKKGVYLGGNIGIPVSSFILKTKLSDTVVVEVSSFQLETILEFRPYVAALLNVEPDHLDRYPSFKDYFKAKMNIFKNQTSSDWAVVNKSLPMLSDVKKCVRSQLVTFSDELSNENYSCIYRIAAVFGLSKVDCLNVLSSFKGLPHRMQEVAKINGVTFINDSKATNPASTVWALRNLKGPVVLIAGGKDKGLDYTEIKPFLGKVKQLNLFGQASEKINEVLGSLVETKIYKSLDEVVKASLDDASKGDTVLFSPMCSSFDMFLNYIQRGRMFVDVVKKLEAGNV